MTQTKRITILSQEKYDGGMFCFGGGTEGSLDAVMDSLKEIRESIPPEYRHLATCEIASIGGHEGSHYATIEVTYDRPEIPQEARDRETRIRYGEMQAEAHELAVYIALRQKFGP